LNTSSVSDSTMKRKVDGMISLGCFILLLIVFVKCSLAITVNELEVGPKITLIADEVKGKLEKTKTKPDQPCQGPPTLGYCIPDTPYKGGTPLIQIQIHAKSLKVGCETTNNAYAEKEDCESKCGINFYRTFSMFLCFDALSFNAFW